jgi:energy-coupling factor transporter transmembrane protein EcfT
MALPKNVGRRDSTIRLIAAAVIMILSFFVPGMGLQMLLVAVALILLFTSWSRTCFAYLPLKIDTRESKDAG